MQAEKYNDHKGLSGARGRTRTTDTRIFNPLLYHLSYPGAAPDARRRASGIRQLPRPVQSICAVGWRPNESMSRGRQRHVSSGCRTEMSGCVGGVLFQNGDPVVDLGLQHIVEAIERSAKRCAPRQFDDLGVREVLL